MKLIKFPSPNLTNNSNKASNSLLYQDWEIDEVIENLSEDEQDLLIERISLLAQSWELTLDSELEAFLQTKYKESKTTFAYTDWLYDLAQEEVYRAYAIEQLDKQRGKVSIADKKGNQSLAASNIQATTTTATTTTDLSADQTTNNNCLLDYEQQIKYDLAQSQVYREYAIEQIELAKQSNAKSIGEFVEIEKVYCDKATNAHAGNVDEPIFDELIFSEPIFDNVSQAAKDESSVQLLDANNEIIINGELTANNNSDTFIRENAILCDVSQLANENVAKEKSLDCHQTVSNSQGYPERLTSPKDCANYHTTKVLPNYSSKFPIKYINQQTSSFSSTSYGWANSLLLTKAKKALLIPSYLGKDTSIYHPPSLPP